MNSVLADLPPHGALRLGLRKSFSTNSFAVGTAEDLSPWVIQNQE